MRESTSRAKRNFLSLSDGETLNTLIDRNIVLVFVAGQLVLKRARLADL